MVIPAGVEPAIFWMRTRRPGPLDDGTTAYIITQWFLVEKTFMAGFDRYYPDSGR